MIRAPKPHSQDRRDQTHGPPGFPDDPAAAVPAEIMPFIKAHENIDDIGYGKSCDERKQSAQESPQKAGYGSPVMNAEIQQKSADSDTKTVFPLNLHIFVTSQAPSGFIAQKGVLKVSPGPKLSSCFQDTLVSFPYSSSPVSMTSSACRSSSASASSGSSARLSSSPR